MAHKKAGGSTSLGRDSNPKYLGVKKFGGQVVRTGDIIIRQRGSKFRPGKGVEKGKDDTLFAMTSGVVKFARRKVTKFTGTLENVRVVSVVPKV